MTGKVPAADLAPLEQLPRLRSLTLSASRSAEEGGEHCLDAFPDMLTRLKGLTSLALCSQGERSHRVGAGGFLLRRQAPHGTVPLPATLRATPQCRRCRHRQLLAAPRHVTAACA